ncbi:pimeloyl-ACP methyl ester esterase BioH [Pragia fontium]|uniref:pimeloyl-ACP methyl ester esterase BioH n=1 Tax=Pragia fontium TaxID=82985 RepID=UPI00064AF1AB|nr:pimeloyl-ACP methyl ester esterase BioH [Pragia fontium]AKJ40880.1 carboxylesterase [Pragia fontium]
MSPLYCQTFGHGETDLVLLHGWGLNTGVWHCIVERLTPHFRVHLIDLPGYGRSQQYGEMELEEMTSVVLNNTPESAVWLGWSMGGLVASKAALMAPERVQALISVASSPCFTERSDEGWPGIKTSVLNGFENQLSIDFQQTVVRFLALQTLGTPDARKDAKQLNQVILSCPMPRVEVLNSGLRMLAENDLRSDLVDLQSPFLRIYGALDGLVPRKIIPQLDQLWPSSHSLMIDHAAHAPFISHPEIFCQEIISFVDKL